MNHIIAVTNQKGGVGKTTTSISVASELALLGRKVLLVDFDPQGSATSGVGIEFQEEGNDVYDMFFGKSSLADIIQETQVENLDLAPASRELVTLESELGKTPGRELILKSEINMLRPAYDYIIIDCPPSSGLLTQNALGASDHVLIPLQAEYYALEGLSALMHTLEFVTKTFNPKLTILGVFITMFDSRTNLSFQVEEEARDFFGDSMFESKVPRNIKLSECPSHGMPICLYDPNSAGARAYHELALEIDERCVGTRGRRKVAANA